MPQPAIRMAYAKHPSPHHYQSILGVVDLSDTVLVLTGSLTLWALLALLPHSTPFNATLLLDLTLAAWSLVAWVLAGVAGVALVGLLLCSTGGHTHDLRFGVCVAAVAALALAIGATVYVPLLGLNDLQNYPNGRLKLCTAHCGTPYEACVHNPVPVFDARLPETRTEEAVAFFRSSVYGPPLPIKTLVVGGYVSVAFGNSQKEECTTRVFLPENATTPIMLAVDGANDHTRSLARRYGWSAVGLPKKPPSTCGSGGQIANEAAVANAVATALEGATGRAIALYGCSRSGKIAVWAAATKHGLPYHSVLVDSGGTLGFASARIVGRCGESFAALVDRWPNWLAHNSSLVRDVADWPAGVDVSDLVLGACAAGTHFAMSSSTHDLWNNQIGLAASVDAAGMHGCFIPLILATGTQHCGLL